MSGGAGMTGFADKIEGSGAPGHCDLPMRGLIVEGLPRGLRRWVCDRCGHRQWYLYGRPTSDADALTYSRREQMLAEAVAQEQRSW